MNKKTFIFFCYKNWLPLLKKRFAKSNRLKKKGIKIKQNPNIEWSKLFRNFFFSKKSQKEGRLR